MTLSFHFSYNFFLNFQIATTLPAVANRRGRLRMKWARRRNRSGSDLLPSSRRSSYLVLYTFCVGTGSRQWNESCTTVCGQREPTCFASNHGAADWWPAAWKVRPVDPLLILWWSHRSGRTFKCSFHQKDTPTHKINGAFWPLLDALTGKRVKRQHDGHVTRFWPISCWNQTRTCLTDNWHRMM